MATNDRHDMTVAIDKAIGELAALKAKLLPASIHTMELQAESALAYVAHAKRVNEIMGDLLIVAVDCAAGLGEQFVMPGMRKDLRTNDLLDDILSDATDWAEEVLHELEAV